VVKEQTAVMLMVLMLEAGMAVDMVVMRAVEVARHFTEHFLMHKLRVEFAQGMAKLK